MLHTVRNHLFSKTFQNFRQSSYKLVSSKEGKEEVYYKNGNLVVFVGEQYQEKLYDIVTTLKSSGGIETKSLSLKITKYYTNNKRQILAFKAHIKWKEDGPKEWSSASSLEKLEVIVSFAEAMQEADYYLQEERFENESCTQICAFLSFFACEGNSENSSKGCLIKYVHYVLSNGGDLEEDYQKITEGKLFWKEDEFPYKMPVIRMCYEYFGERTQPIAIWRRLEQEEYYDRLDEDYEIVNPKRIAKELSVIEENDIYTVYEGNIKIYHNMPSSLREFLNDTDIVFRQYRKTVVESVLARIINFEGEIIGYRFSDTEGERINFQDSQSSYEIVKTCTDIQAYLLQLQRKLRNLNEWWDVNNEFNIEESFAFSGKYRTAYKIKDIWSLCTLRETSFEQIKKQITQIFFKWYIAYLNKEYGKLETRGAFLEKVEVRYLNPILAKELIHFALDKSVDYEAAMQAFREFVDSFKVYGQETRFCVDERYIYNSVINPFLFDYEFQQEYGMRMKKGMNEMLPNGQLVVSFKRNKNLSSVMKQLAKAQDNFEHKIAKTDKQLKLIGVSKFIYSRSINSEGMYSVVGYVTEPMIGQQLTTNVLLSLNNRELYEVIDILFSKFTDYWIPKGSDIWLESGHPVNSGTNKIYVNVLSESFKIEKWNRSESFIDTFMEYLIRQGYNPYAFYVAKQARNCTSVDWSRLTQEAWAYCEHHKLYHIPKFCPVCTRTQAVQNEDWDWWGSDFRLFYKDETAAHYISKIHRGNKREIFKMYRKPSLVSDTIKENVEKMIEAGIRIELMKWLKVTSKDCESEDVSMFGQEGFIPRRLVINQENEVIGYTYTLETESNTTLETIATDLQDTQNLKNRPRLMALIRLMLQIQELVKQGKGFIQNPFSDVFLAKAYKKQVQILNIDYLSSEGNKKETKKWTCDYVCQTLALDDNLDIDTSNCGNDFDMLFIKMRILAKRLTKYCSIHQMYYDEAKIFCPKCFDKKDLENLITEEVEIKEVTCQDPIGEGGESFIYPYGENSVAKVFRDDIVDKKFKLVVLSHVMKKREILEKANAENRYYHYVIPQKLLVESESHEFFAYVMEKVQGMPLSNLKDKKEIEKLGFSMQDVFEILITVGKGIENLHQNNIYIGDLNGRNILFDAQKKVYFLEFDGMGIDEIAPVFCTDGYIDPVSKKNQKITMKDDWYSFAVQAFYYLTFTHPFNGIYSVKVKGEEVILSLTDKMERKISLLGNHGMEVPALARPWDWMSSSLKNAFLSIFERGSRESLLPKLVQEYNRMYKKSSEADIVAVVKNMVNLRAKKEDGNVIRINPKFIATRIDAFSGLTLERVINENAAIIGRNRENATIELMVCGHKIVIKSAGEKAVIKNVMLLQDQHIALVIYEEKTGTGAERTYSRIIAYELNKNQLVYEEFSDSEIRYEVVNGNTLYFLTDNEMIEKRTFMPDGQVKKEQIEFLTSKKTRGFFVQDNSKFIIIKEKEGKEGRDEIYCNAQKLCEINGFLPNCRYNIIYDATSRTWLIINSEGNAIIIEANGKYVCFYVGNISEVENIKYQKRTIYIPGEDSLYIEKREKDQISSKKLECHKIMTPQTRLYNINQEGFSMITDNTFYEVRRG